MNANITTRPTINLNLSTAFHNKHILAPHDKRAFGTSFHPQSITTSQLTSHITTGGAFTMGYYQGNTRRKDTFVSSQIVALDLDSGVSVQDCIQHSFVSEYAYLIYATPSSTEDNPKTRVLFILSDVIDNVRAWERLQRALIWYCHELAPDPACKDAARLFFGSTKPGYQQYPNKRLPVVLLEMLAGEMDEELGIQPERTEADNEQIKQQNRAHAIDDKKRQRYERYARTALDNMAGNLSAQSEGARNVTLYKYAASAGNLIAAGIISYTDCIRALYNAAYASGLTRHEIESTLKNGLANGQKTPLDLQALDRKWLEKRRAKPPDFVTRDTTDYEALSEDEYRAILLERIAQYEAGIYRSWWDFNGIYAGWLSALLGLTKTRSSTVLVLLRMHDCFRDGSLNWALFSAADVEREVKLPRATVAAALEDLREWTFVRFVWTGSKDSILPTQKTKNLGGRPTRYYTIETDTSVLHLTLSRMITNYHIEKYHAKTLAPVDAQMAEQIGITDYADYQAYKTQMAAVKQDYHSKEAQKALTKELHGDGYNWHGWERALEWQQVVWFDWWYECETIADVRALFLRWWIENVRDVNTRLELQRVLGCSDTALGNIMERAHIGSERRDKSAEFPSNKITDFRELTRNIQRKERAMIWAVRFKYVHGWKTIEANGRDLAQQAAYIYARDKADIEKVWVKYCQPSVQFLLSEEQLENATEIAQDAITGDSSALADNEAAQSQSAKKRKEAAYKQRNHNWTKHRLDWLYNQLRLRVWCFTLLTLEGWRLLDSTGQVVYEGTNNADVTRWLNSNASTSPLRKTVDFFGLSDDDPRELDIEITNILTFENRYFEGAWSAERAMS